MRLHRRTITFATLVIPTIAILSAFQTTPGTARAEPSRASDKQLNDRRLGKLRTTDDSEFPMRRVSIADDWPARRNEIRTRILVSAGLHPLPQRSPLNSIIHGRVEREDYTVERVIFESFPGHYVSGSLYRPKSSAGSKLPAVLNPHGHWVNGRFQDHGLELVRSEINSGAERFEVGGRHLIQARCVQLARMGCIAFVYDMEGYADNIQLINHWLEPRRDAADKSGYLLFSPQAELRGQTLFGLQTWNSIRALDFICALDDVDTNRIGITGESGGGTQSMILAAIDDRVAAAMPAVMVSTGMQGGCTCENASYLRINQGNVDIAAAIAPRPLGLICADDWTKDFETKGHPDLKLLYAMLRRPDKYEAHFHLEFPHNYNSVNRHHMYSFMNRHLKLGLPEPIVERDFVPLDVATEASVWTAMHPKPIGNNIGEAHERKLTAEWTKATDAALKDMSEADRLRVIAEGLTTFLGRLPTEVGSVKWEQTSEIGVGDSLMMTGTLNVTDHGERLPALLIYPKWKWNRQIVVWIGDAGKKSTLSSGAPNSWIADLVSKGYAVASLDMFGQGEFIGEGGNAVEFTRIISQNNGNEPYRKAACYTFGFNPPLIAQRVHDVMSLVEFLRHEQHKRKVECIHLVAIGEQAGAIGLLARFALGDRIEKAAVNINGFNFKYVDRLDHPMFLPGILRYGGIDALWELNRPLGIAKSDSPAAACSVIHKN